MNRRGWTREEERTANELPADSWMQGFFPTSEKIRGFTVWRRGFHDLMRRDLLLFCLGDVQGKRVLEIGCAEGVYLEIIARMGGEIYGQDLSAQYVADGIANLTRKGFRPEIKIGNATRLLFGDAFFDCVLAPDFFAYLSREEKDVVVGEVYRVLKPGGIFAIKTPNLDYLKLSLFFKRICSLFQFRSPFSIHIPHTRNNPDNQNFGLTTYQEMESILLDNSFHRPGKFYTPLMRNSIPMWATRFVLGCRFFSEDVLMSARKPLFLGYYP